MEFVNPIVCQVKQSKKKRYIFLNATLPVYLLHVQKQSNQLDDTKYKFIQFMTDDPKSYQSATIDTHELNIEEVFKLKKRAEKQTPNSPILNRNDCVSYNDLLAVKYCL